MASLIGPRCPPYRALAARFIKAACAARVSKANVDGNLARSDGGHHSVKDSAAILILFEAEPQESADEISGLRSALADCVPQLTGDRIYGVSLVLFPAMKEGYDIAHRCQSQAEDDWILPCIRKLVEPVRVKSFAKANGLRVGLAGESRFGAVAPTPIAACKVSYPAGNASDCLYGSTREERMGCVEIDRERRRAGRDIAHG